MGGGLWPQSPKIQPETPKGETAGCGGLENAAGGGKIGPGRPNGGVGRRPMPGLPR